MVLQEICEIEINLCNDVLCKLFTKHPISELAWPLFYAADIFRRSRTMNPCKETVNYKMTHTSSKFHV